MVKEHPMVINIKGTSYGKGTFYGNKHSMVK